MTPFSDFLSRRDFLKLAGLGFATAFLPTGSTKAHAASGLLPDQEGRVAETNIQLFEKPSPNAAHTKEAWQDIVLPITGIALSDDEEAHNRIWYKMGEDGYAYSGDIQPVLTRLNKPVHAHPKEGSLVEVSVPYTDARTEPKEDAELVYRLYYETTHWVVETIIDENTQKVWYLLRDDKWNDKKYYVLASHLRIIPSSELRPISPEVPEYKKSIEVRLRQQIVVAYEGSHPVFAARAATGARFASGKYFTPQGIFKTYYKRPSRHMAAGNLANSGYDLPGVPWVLYITESGISFHGTYWHNDFGHPRSHGCINLAPHAAKWLYRWTAPVVKPDKEFVYGYTGTHVEIIE
ncbi:MAG: L,D-transpeptidase [Anaerolineae bacterium]|jgi:lipoprotein-anchoring transpeptidase ErfK/SrfK|nr:L,D-transpeptidase [Anaerolineae bacterium]